MAISRFSRSSIIAASIFAFASFAIAIRGVALSILDFGQRWLESAMAVIADPRPALALVREGWADLVPGGSPLDAALLNGLRHESRIARRGAHRHI